MTCPHADEILTCITCAAEAKGSGGDQLAAWRRARADALCDREFPRRYVTARADSPKVLAWAAQYLANPREARSLLLAGPVGTGKTYQAFGALRIAAAKARTWEATTYADFAAALRPGGRDPEGDLRRFRTCELLLLDDLGAAKSSEWVEEVGYRLINDRYQDMRPAVFTTNLPLSELREGLGDRIASRLVETCDIVTLTGPDRRRAAA